jgi:hypothetical protein
MTYQVSLSSSLLLSFPTASFIASEFEEGDYNGNGVTSIFDSSADEPTDELELNSPEKLEENFDLNDESGTAITSLECVLWKNNEFNQGATTGSPQKSNLPSTRIEWTIMVGDSAGRLTLLDITDVRYPLSLLLLISLRFLSELEQPILLQSDKLRFFIGHLSLHIFSFLCL